MNDNRRREEREQRNLKFKKCHKKVNECDNIEGKKHKGGKRIKNDRGVTGKKVIIEWEKIKRNKRIQN